MNRWKLAVPVVACVALFAAGCAAPVAVQDPGQPGAGPEPVSDTPPQEVVVQSAPPPEQVEVIPRAPSTEYVWIQGHWHWDGVRWTWRRGHYSLRRVGYRWIPAHYAQRGGGVVYVPGYWGR